MIKLNLTPQNKQEELILNYLQNNASESLADKINNGTPFEKDGHPLLNKKTLSGFMRYACDEARKLAEKGAKFVLLGRRNPVRLGKTEKTIARYYKRQANDKG